MAVGVQMSIKRGEAPRFRVAFPFAGGMVPEESGLPDLVIFGRRRLVKNKKEMASGVHQTLATGGVTEPQADRIREIPGFWEESGFPCFHDPRINRRAFQRQDCGG